MRCSGILPVPLCARSHGVGLIVGLFDPTEYRLFCRECGYIIPTARTRVIFSSRSIDGQNI
jgi:hypothetical protein